MKKYYVIACHVLWREICQCAASSPNVHDLRFLEQGLHNTPDLLRAELQRAIDATPPGWDATLIGYGLCSRGIEGIQARDVPLVFVRGHDCITFLLGSKERYQDYFNSHPGTYWYSPGWIDTHTQPGPERFEKLLSEYAELYGEENARYLIEAGEGWRDSYECASYVAFPGIDDAAYVDYTRRCAEWLGWRFDALPGDPSLIADLLAGNWDDDRFLVVQPGEKVAASYEEDIIAAAPSCDAACPGCKAKPGSE